MSPDRFAEITRRFAGLRIAIVGDFCLDRYLEIDPGKQEISIETGLAVHNVTNVRAQPGGAGTILSNLVSLGIGELHAVGYCGDDGEGYELYRSLAGIPGVHLDHFLRTPARRTFTYCKPLVLEHGRAPRELSRLDTKNWTATPDALQCAIAQNVIELGEFVDAMILLEQVDVPDTGVISKAVRDAAHVVMSRRPELLVLADSRRGLRDFPPLAFKMNASELGAMFGEPPSSDIERIAACTTELARRNHQPVFVTVSEHGIVGADAKGNFEYVPALPVRGPIDIVGAGDSVTASLTAALAAGATLREGMFLAMATASVVVHQLGTTGTATPGQIAELMGFQM